MNRIFLLLLLAGSSLLAGTQSLNGDWRFALASTPEDLRRLESFHQPAFSGSDFRPIAVPSNWALKGFEEPAYGVVRHAGEGFYRTSFQVPAAWAGQRVVLHFDGVWDSAEVWLNGNLLGRHDSGFTSFAFDITPHLTGTNLLAVRVRQITRDSLYDVNDDWSLGGIFRDVWLESMPRDRYIDRVETSTVFDAAFRDADLNIRVGVVQIGKRFQGSYTLTSTLLAPDGHQVQRTRLTVPDHRETGRDVLLKMHVRAPLAWTAETPRLYRLRVDLDNIQSREHAVGFRQVSTNGGVLRLNGRPIRLRGVCRHDQHPDVGTATRREHWLEDLRLMKAANVNAIRMVHYPPARGFLDLCDEMGLYVIDEVPMGYGGGLGNDPSYTPAVFLRTHETIDRDRNHPSVIIWSIGNENPITPLHIAALRYVKGADPTRPTLFAWHAPSELGDPLPPEIDIAAPHYPNAIVAEGIVSRSTRPVVATEYTHALGENGFGGLAHHWKALTAAPAGAGGMIWMWQDQGLRRGTGPGSPILLTDAGTDGIVRADRTLQRDYWETKAVYAPVIIPLDRVKLLIGQTDLRVPVLNDYDFSDLTGHSLVWTLWGNDHQLAKGTAQVAAAPRTTAWFPVPLETISRPRADTAYYLHIAVLAPDGATITRRSIELEPAISPAASHPAERPCVVRRKPLELRCGAATYGFDPATGQLASVSANGRRLVHASHITIWRPLEKIESSNYVRRGFDPQTLPELDRYTSRIVALEFPGPSRIHAVAEHTVDANNRFRTEQTYEGLPDGSLRVEYTVRPAIRALWIPEVGVELETARELASFRWLGLGPLEAYPNLKEAAIFGLWSGDNYGVKADVRWAELTGKDGAGIRAASCGYVRVPGPGRIRILSAVEGRPSKFNRPEYPEERLDTISPRAFYGAFTIKTILGPRH